MVKGHFGPGLIAVAVALALAACGEAKPFEYTPGSEIPPGPGLFSGEDGEFVIFGSSRTETKEEPSAGN